MRSLVRGIVFVTLAVALSGCTGGTEDGAGEEEASASPPPEAATPAESEMEAVGEQEEDSATAAEDSMAASPAVEEAIAPPAAGVPPAPGVEDTGLRNWMVIEFARDVEKADLEWLEQNSFHVDTVMGPRMIRGWLEDAAAGSRLSQDPRVASIHAQMR